MKILVPVKHVASLPDGVVPDGDGALAADVLQWAPNEWDAHALEAALALNESAPGEDDELVVVTVGDARAEDSLRAALALGADRAIRLSDDALATDAPTGPDTLAVARVLAAIAERERPELILCGAQSSDAASAATGIALAGLLELAHVAFAVAIERDGGRLTVERELEGGASEVSSVALPALLTIQTGANRPRRANLRAIKQARTEPISVIGLDELGLDAASVQASAGSRAVRLRERERSTRARPIEGTPVEVAAQISAIVEQALNR
jgi:electron transfer flavoprotein beta subunit